MSELAVPFGLFAVIVLVFGIVMIVNPQLINDVILRWAGATMGRERAKMLMISGARSSGVFLVIGAVVLLWVAIFVFAPSA